MPFGIRIDIGNKHDAAILARLDLIYSHVRKLMATSKELLDLANAVAAGIPASAAAVDALEAKVTAALAQIGGVPADVQADIDTAFAALSSAVAGLSAVSADAGDGVDEAAPAP